MRPRIAVSKAAKPTPIPTTATELGSSTTATTLRALRNPDPTTAHTQIIARDGSKATRNETEMRRGIPPGANPAA